MGRKRDKQTTSELVDIVQDIPRLTGGDYYSRLVEDADRWTFSGNRKEFYSPQGIFLGVLYTALDIFPQGSPGVIAPGRQYAHGLIMQGPKPFIIGSQAFVDERPGELKRLHDVLAERMDRLYLGDFPAEELLVERPEAA